jgi:hypothetical protein
MAFSRLSGPIRLVLLVVCALPGTARALSGDVPVGAGSDLKIKPPLPVWPSDHERITSRRPQFRFNGRFEATRYRVELASNPAFGKPRATTETRVLDDGGIEPVFVAACPGDPLEPGQYYWRVFAGDDSGFWTPPANYRTFFVVAEAAEGFAVPARPVHPRLLLSATELDAFKRRVGRSPRLGPGWQYLLNAANGMLDTPPPAESYARAGAGQHGNYNIASHWYHRHLLNTGFAAYVTGDDRLAAKGVEILMAACAYERWLGPEFENPGHFNPPWHSALETAMMTTAVATGYDLLYERLTDAQRAAVQRSLVEKGIRPLVEDWADPVGASRLPRHQLPTGNWVMVCSSSAGVGALALLGEHPDAPRWTRLVRNRVRAWLRDRGGDWFADNPWPQGRPDPIPVIGPSEPNFGIDGGYKESITYMNYAMMYVCLFADGLRRAGGDNLFDDVPAGLLEPAAWSILAWPEDGAIQQSLVPFGDCGTTAAFPLLYAALTKHRRDPRAAWLNDRVVPIPQDIRELVWLDESVPGSEPDAAVPMARFRDIGQVVMRSGWGPDAPVAAIKFRQNRGHLDIGSFYLFGGGHPTLVDSGSSPYGSSIYNQYSSQSIAHNLVLVDNQPQVRADGQLLAAVGTSRVTAASGQLAAAYPGVLTSWTRDLVMLPGGLAVVLDRLSAREPHRFDLVLHPYWPFKQAYPVASPGEIWVGEASPTRIRVHSEAAFKVSEQDGYYLTTPRKYLRLDTPEPTAERTYLTVCEWPARTPAQAQRPVEVSALAPGRWQVRSVSEHWRLMVRTGSEAGVNDSTDARLVAVWDEGEDCRERHALVLAGRRFGVDNRELMRSTRPLHAAIEFGRPLWAHLWAAEPTRVTLTADPEADFVFLNGVRVDPSRRGNSITLDIPAGESTVVAGPVPKHIPRPRSVVVDDLPAVSASVNAPAFQPGVTARSSSCVPEALLAIDGDANTGWHALPGMDLPQWIEVDLPATRKIGRVRIATGPASNGRVEWWSPAQKKYVVAGSFATTPERPSATVAIPDAPETDRLRVTVEATAGGATAGINSLEYE